MRDRPEPGHAGAHTLALARPSGPRVPEHVPSRRAPPPPLRRHRPATSGPGRPLGRRLLARAGAAERGHGAVLLPRHLHHDRIRRRRRRAWWRVLAGIEGLTGILLVAWSTAFVFAVVNRTYEHWRQVHSAS